MFDTILADAGIKVVRSGVRMRRMNAVMERWVPHLLHGLRQFEVCRGASQRSKM